LTHSHFDVSRNVWVKNPSKKLMTLWSVRTGGGEGWWKDENQLPD
jgi:hypothetical protein